MAAAACAWCGKTLQIIGPNKDRLHRHACKDGRTSRGSIKKGTVKAA